MACILCGSNNINHVGVNPYTGMHKFVCNNCGKDFVGKYADAFDTYHQQDPDYKKCPSCGMDTLFWLGFSPTDIECANKYCKFYKPITKENRIKYACDKKYEESMKEDKAKKRLEEEEMKKKAEESVDEDTRDLDPLDFGAMFP